MFYFPKFYYEEGTGDNGVGGATDTIPPTGNDTPEPLLTSEMLKEYGLENKDQLMTILRQHKESNIPAGEKEKQEQLRKADFIKFSAENDLMKVDEVSAYETLKNKADRDLVFEKYLDEWKEDNPDVEDAEEIQAQARSEFE